MDHGPGNVWTTVLGSWVFAFFLPGDGSCALSPTNSRAAQRTSRLRRHVHQLGGSMSLISFWNEQTTINCVSI